jgi:RNA polymerase sigma-70 factor, ECF subfamily
VGSRREGRITRFFVRNAPDPGEMKGNLAIFFVRNRREVLQNTRGDGRGHFRREILRGRKHMSELNDSRRDSTLPEAFVRVLLANQGNIHAYITSLLGNLDQAEEILQETNVVLCREVDQFPTITDFTAWACRIAYFQVLKYRKRCQRDRHWFDDALLSLVAEEAAPQTREFGKRRQALNECLDKLSDLQRNLIMRRYGANSSVQSVAREYGRSPGAISQSLYRIRAALLKCIQHRVAVSERGCQ